MESEIASPAAVSRTFRQLAMLYRGRPGYGLALRGFVRDSLACDEEEASASYRNPAHCDRLLAPPPLRSGEWHYDRGPRPVRSFVASAAEQAGLSASRTADLVLAISELAANTLRHTSAGGTLRVWRSTKALICQVQDTGKIMDPLAGAQQRYIRALWITGLARRMSLYDDVEKAVAAAGSARTASSGDYPGPSASAASRVG